MPKLYLRLLTNATPVEDEDSYNITVEWLLRDNDGTVRGHGETDYRGLADVADPNVEWLGDPQNTIVFVPSQFVLRIACEVPGRSTAQIRRALPFAAEEYVATDIESMHIAHDAIRAGQPVDCNIVSHQQMQNWIGCLNAVGVSPGFFIADAEVLPRGEGQASLLFTDSTVLIADAAQAAVIDRNNLPFALAGLQVDSLTAINGVPTDLELSNTPEAVAIETVEFGTAGLLEYLADRFDAATFINLLQGAYQPVRRASQHAGKWRAVLGLAATWLLVSFLAMIVEGYWAGHEADRLQTESFSFFKSMFPRESQPVSSDQLRRRISAKLGTKAGGEASGSAFVGLTAHLANVLKMDNRVAHLGYADTRDELTAEVMMNDYDQLEVLKTDLAAAGVAIEVTNADQDGERVRARVRVKYQ